MTLNDWIKHFFHVVSNVRPLVWICLYVGLMPLFACIYSCMPPGQFRIPDGGATDWGSWLYYSIVTLTTLGFGDYTPALKLAQAVTAIEVMCGLVVLGLFLNAVGSMKSEIDVASEVEKQKRAHEAMETAKLKGASAGIVHAVNVFLGYCYAVTTPEAKRAERTEYDPGFTFSDMQDMFKPSGLPYDGTTLPAVERLIKSASRLALALDGLQGRVDLTLWPKLLEDSFSFVANFQVFDAGDSLARTGGVSDSASLAAAIGTASGVPTGASGEMGGVVELYYYIKENAALAQRIGGEVSLRPMGPTQ